MRTTLSLDDDVAAQLEAWRAGQAITFKEAVNTALRRGLNELSRPMARRRFRTTPVDMGQCLVASLDSVWDVLDEVDAPAGKLR